jgi:DNA-binding MarR family transcriptional regulator
MNKDHILFLIGRINYKVGRRLVKALKRHNVTGIAPSHGEIIGALILAKQLTMKEIAGIIDKDKSTVTALVTKLVTLGYIRKQTDATDSRVSVISLTPAGQALKPAFMAISRELRKKAYGSISEKEKRTLYDLLMKVNNTL